MLKRLKFNNWKRVVSLCLCVLILLPAISQAAFLSNSVPISSDQIGKPVQEDGGVTDSIVNFFGLGNYLNTFNSAMSKINKVQCYSEAAKKALEVAEKVDSWSFGGLKLLSGDSGEALMIKGKITALDAAKACVEGKLKDVKDTPIATLIQGQLRQSLIQQYTTELATIQKRLDELNAQYRNATRNFWKSVLVKVLLTTTKAVAQKLVNNLTNTYKIKDFQGYADAVASQVYTTNLIRKNVPDGADQLILRSMLNNPLAVQSVMPAVRQRTDAALGFSPDEVNFDDPDFYMKMSRVGAGDTNPFAVHVAMVDEAYQLQSKGSEAAKSEIIQSNGFKTPKDCPGNIAEQQMIDQRYQAASRELQDRNKLYSELISAKNLGLPVSDQDIAQAKQDMEQANKQLEALPKVYKSPVLEICRSITSPASLVDKGIDKAFNQFAKNLGDYNDNNLPFFINFISDIASGIASDLIFGGNGGSVLLSESGNIDKALGTGLAFATSGNNSQNLQNGVNFTYQKSSNFTDAYTLSWEVLDVKDASYVTIQGTGISPTQKFPLSGSTEVRTSSGGAYLLKVFDSKGKQLTSGSIDLQVQQTNPYITNGSGPRVFGASVNRLATPIRGPVGVQPRGPAR